MIDICMALDQSVSPHTGVWTIQNTGGFWQAVFQPPRLCSLFLEHGSAALISHPHNTASYAGYKKGYPRMIEITPIKVTVVILKSSLLVWLFFS